MFNVPGRYSGGKSSSYTWTQTLHEVELRAPLPQDLPQRSVKCVFAARTIDLSWEGAAAPIAGELLDTVVIDDSLWVVEREGTGAVVVATMRKAAPKVCHNPNPNLT